MKKAKNIASILSQLKKTDRFEQRKLKQTTMDIFAKPALGHN